MKDLFLATGHRPYPYPVTPWVMTQAWNDLLFAHWKYEPEVVQKLIPPQFKIDTFDGAAWIGVVPFKMQKVRPRFTVELPVLSEFLELNVRTYVTVGGVPGVYFFSLDCESLFAVEGARKWFHLPYYYAEMNLREANGEYAYRSTRVDKRGLAAQLDVQYRPTGDVCVSAPGSLEEFLTERYCLYTISGDGDILRAHVHHDRWPLQPAEAEFKTNTMLSPIGLEAIAKPVLYFSKSLLTVEWAPDVVPGQ
ncbi:MAG: DUF2071 domain-containing protein [Candidatus Melainabacteria bacterium]|nr:DUF2071 domain-containing protein [Candidatus Melainabacteria bacterium]